MKIFAVGWNYPLHNRELSDLATEPTIFMKPDTALLRCNKPFYIPNFTKQVDYETEIVLRICRLGKNISERFAYRYYDAVALGVDFTARDLQRQQKACGGPWEIAKAFDGSAVISPFLPMESLKNPKNIDFELKLNGKTVQHATTSQMIRNFDQIIAYISQFFTLKMGDLIYTGTPEGVGTVAINDHLQGFIENKPMFDFWVK